MTLWLFDLAGTVIRDGDVVRRAFVAIAHELGYPALPDAWYRGQMGRRKATVFRELAAEHGRTLDDGTIAALEATFDERVASTYRTEGVELLPGAAALMAQLRARGARIGFTTGFGPLTAATVTGALPFTFDHGVTSDQVANGRPAPDLIHAVMARLGVENPEHVATVGDTPNDLHAGARAGCARIIGVGNGTHTLEQLAPSARETGAELVETLADVSLD